MQKIVGDEELRKYLSLTDKFVFLKFYAEWCGPCRVIGETLKSLENELSDKIEVVEINVDHAEFLAGRYNVTTLPTIVLIKNGVEMETYTGLLTRQNILDLIDKVN